MFIVWLEACGQEEACNWVLSTLKHEAVTWHLPPALPSRNLCSSREYCRHNFPAGTKLVLAGTIQFASCIQAARQALAADYPHLTVPQVGDWCFGG